MSDPVITLTTDFGNRDPFVGIMKGVILGICPRAGLVDLTHEIPPQDVLQAALALHDAVPFFPAGTIHLVVVDPGVGTARTPVCLRTPDADFVGPDNGVFGLVLDDTRRRHSREAGRVVELAETRFFLPEVSATFHGRDVFAPVAAHLALGVSPDDLGPRRDGVLPAPLPAVEQSDADTIIGQVIHVDRFGNCVTNIGPDDLGALSPAAGIEVTAAGMRFGPVCTNYADVQRGQALALVGSSGRLELALREGDLGGAGDLGPGSPVQVRRRRQVQRR